MSPAGARRSAPASVAALGVEQVELAGVGPEVGFLAAADFAGRLEAGDNLLLALAFPGGAGLCQAFADEVGELLGLDLKLPAASGV